MHDLMPAQTTRTQTHRPAIWTTLRNGLAVLLATVIITGCAYTREKLDLDTSAKLFFKIAEDVNPDTNGRASPVVVNLLFLSNNRQFEQEDLISLMENAEDRLGKDLMNKVRLKEFIPGETRSEFFELTAETTYIGVVTEYIQYQKAEAKLLLKLEPHTNNKFSVRVNRLSMAEKK